MSSSHLYISCNTGQNNEVFNFAIFSGYTGRFLCLVQFSYFFLIIYIFSVVLAVFYITHNALWAWQVQEFVS